MITEKQIKAAAASDKAYSLRDGNGLFLEVRPSGTKVFVRKYRWRGTQRSDTLGSFPDLKLVEARSRAVEIGLQVKQKIDPRGERVERSRGGPKPKAKVQEVVPVERRYETLAGRFMEKRIAEGMALPTVKKVRRHIYKWELEKRRADGTVETIWMRSEAMRVFEGRDVGSIKPPEVLNLVERIQQQGHLEKAKDVHRKLGEIFDLAIALGYIEWNPARQVKRAIVRTKSGGLPGLTDAADVGALMRAVEEYDGSI
ncbi:MAG: Arm DNA-binding domain-containing protein, partial [Rhodobacteraceae bacterium]|nr:Arm DNA-binding domain-containing protein [Paracoccaceae bacterium]